MNKWRYEEVKLAFEKTLLKHGSNYELELTNATGMKFFRTWRSIQTNAVMLK